MGYRVVVGCTPDSAFTAPPSPPPHTQLGDKISSKIVHGVLEVTVPYAPEGVTRRQIAVNTINA